MASLLQGNENAGIEPLAGKVDLIYIDPPFDTGADFSFRTHIGDEAINKEPSIIEQFAYRDTWGRSPDSYIQMMYERLVLIREALSPHGSIYVHAGPNIAHYIKVLMDDVFGHSLYLNEIIWKRTSSHNDVSQGLSRFGRQHDSILYYAMSDNARWNVQFGAYDPEYVKSHYGMIEKDSDKKYTTSDLTAAKPGGDTSYEWKGVVPPRGRYWAYSRANMERFEANGRLSYSSKGMPRLKHYLDDMLGVSLGDIWTDVPPINSQATERLGYDTQKPEALLERIIRTSSNEGDLVADFFLGSGTTAAVAHKLGRRWIGVDLGRFAIHTSRKRLLDLGATFDVLNLGKYERSHWQGVTLGDQFRAYLDFILSLYHAEPVPGFKHLHGVKAGRAVHIGAVDAPVTFDELDDVLAECRTTSTHTVDVLGWEWEMGVNQQPQQRAETYGVDLRLYQIPNDVMDRRAKAADVKFYSLAYIEAAIRHVQSRTVQVELTDFIIPDLDLIPEAVRDKVKRWSDYIDYWSVDFNYQQDTLALSEANVFRNGWQAFRTRARRTLDTTSATHTYDAPGTYTIAIKVVDVFGIDSTKCLEVTV